MSEGERCGEDAAVEALVTTPRSSVAQHAYEHTRVLRLRDFEAAEPLAASEREAYRRRFLTLFEDETTRRRGGLGRVSRVTNAMGEEFALKVLTLPDATGADPASDSSPALDTSLAPDTAASDAPAAVPAPASDAAAAALAPLVAAFREEYACQRALSGLRGFPRLYGWGMIGDAPAIVMEWVRGETLAHARVRLAVDDEGRLSPLTAAQLGRDLFDLLCRMELVDDGYVHRDVSPANVMVRTSEASLEDQAEDGSFDLCLIDFGSAVAAGSAEKVLASEKGASRKAAPAAAPAAAAPAAAAAPGPASAHATAPAYLCNATASYAPPEMLDDSQPHPSRLRRSPAVDVYEASSVLYQLVCGRVPYELDGVSSPCRLKSDTRPAPPVSAHDEEGASMAELLPREPEVAVMVARILSGLSPEPTPEDVRRALAFVDGQLASVVLSGLSARQEKRPTARGMRDALSAFVANYEANLARALRGEVLIPVTEGPAWLDSASPLSPRRVVRSVGTAVSRAVWLVVVLSATFLLQGAPVAFALGGLRWSGQLGGLVVALALAAPTVAAVLARGRSAGSRLAFARATAVLVLLTALVLGLASRTAFVPPERAQGALAAVFATFAAAWCPMVLDFATLVVPAIVQEMRRRLPAKDGAATAAEGAHHAPAGIGPDAAAAMPASPAEGEAHAPAPLGEKGQDGPHTTGGDDR